MQFCTSLIVAALPYLATAVKTQRTFAVNRIQGKGLTYGRMDPIVAPGQPSGHTHMITGANAFDLTMDTDVTSTATCTNSLVKNDLSNYWIPNLYFQSPNGSFTSVEMFYMNVYYFFEATDDEIKPFPRGFRMTAGDPFLRSPPAGGYSSNLDPKYGAISPVQITCPLNSSKSPRWPANSDGMHGVGIADPNNNGQGVGFPDQNCDGFASPMRLDVHFPSCYNPAAGLEDYKNNNAYPSSEGAKNGQNCPKGWVHLPHLFYEVYFDTPKFKDQWTQGQGKQPFVLAQGDSTGYGLHGDFMAGWDENTLQHIIDTCNAGDSGMDKCPDIPGGLVSSDAASKCTKPAADPSEQVLGVLDELPGCNKVTGAGPAAPKGGCGDQPSQPAPQSSGSAPAPSGSAPVSSSKPQPSAPAASTPASPAPSKSAQSQPVVSQAAPSTAPSAPASPQGYAPNGWTSLGCFADSKSARALPGPTTNLLQTMTIQLCTDFCTSKGMPYAGLEWKSECYCGTTAPTQTSDKCTDKCVGDQTQTCGGSGAISVFKSWGAQSKREAGHGHAMRHARRARRADVEAM